MKSNISFRVSEKKEYTLIHFELNETIEPDILKNLKPPEIDPTKGVILSGRGPIWLYCFLVHFYHPTKFIATYDPRLGGAVVVESHSVKYKVGEIVKINSE